MDSPAFTELKYRAWDNYLNNLTIDKEVDFNWEKELPVGRKQLEHYLKASEMLLDIIKDNVENTEIAVLMIPAHFWPILAFTDKYVPNKIIHIVGVYQHGKLGNTAVAIEPTLNDYMLLFDVAKNKVIRINQGKYDYEEDRARLMTEMGVMK